MCRTADPAGYQHAWDAISKKKHAWAATSIGVFADVDGKASRPPPEKPSLPIPIYDDIT
jgi:hypothetical protein